MINEERVRRMVKLAVYDENIEKKEKKPTQYFQKDYIAIELIKSFIYGTIAYLLMIGMLGIYFIGKDTDWISTKSLLGLVIVLVILYLAFIIAFLVVTYKIYSTRYAKGKARLREYQNTIQEVNELYQEELGKTPEEWL